MNCRYSFTTDVLMNVWCVKKLEGSPLIKKISVRSRFAVLADDLCDNFSPRLAFQPVIPESKFFKVTRVQVVSEIQLDLFVNAYK